MLDAQHPNEQNQNISYIAVIIVQTIFALSGVVNVTLFLFTRPGILLLGETPMQVEDISAVGLTDSVVAVNRRGQDGLKSRPSVASRRPTM